jgi:hypothetical protein
VGGIDQLSKDLEKVLAAVDGEHSLASLLHNNESEIVSLEKQVFSDVHFIVEKNKLSPSISGFLAR